MGCCYLLEIALHAGFTNVLLLSTEESIACRVYKCVAAGDSVEGRVHIHTEICDLLSQNEHLVARVTL